MNLKPIIFTSFLIALQAHSLMGIMGGSPAQPHRFKNVVALQVFIVDYYETFCSGAIVTRMWVLTAGNCIQLMEQLNVPIEKFLVVAGTINVRGRFPNGQYLHIIFFMKHDQFAFHKSLFLHDLGLIKVDGEGFIENDEVAIYPLAPVDNQLPLGYTDIAGWGALNNTDTDRRNYPDTLQVVPAEFIDRGGCRNLINDVYRTDIGAIFQKSLISNRYVCTGPLHEGRSMCVGDAGGPLNLINGTGHNYVAALISMKIGDCGRKNTPAVHINISKFKRWVATVMSKYL